MQATLTAQNIHTIVQMLGADRIGEAELDDILTRYETHRAYHDSEGIPPLSLVEHAALTGVPVAAMGATAALLAKVLNPDGSIRDQAAFDRLTALTGQHQ